MLEDCRRWLGGMRTLCRPTLGVVLRKPLILSPQRQYPQPASGGAPRRSRVTDEKSLAASNLEGIVWVGRLWRFKKIRQPLSPDPVSRFLLGASVSNGRCG